MCIPVHAKGISAAKDADVRIPCETGCRDFSRFSVGEVRNAADCKPETAGNHASPHKDRAPPQGPPLFGASSWKQKFTRNGGGALFSASEKFSHRGEAERKAKKHGRGGDPKQTRHLGKCPRFAIEGSRRELSELGGGRAPRYRRILFPRAPHPGPVRQPWVLTRKSPTELFAFRSLASLGMRSCLGTWSGGVASCHRLACVPLGRVCREFFFTGGHGDASQKARNRTGRAIDEGEYARPGRTARNPEEKPSPHALFLKKCATPSA